MIFAAAALLIVAALAITLVVRAQDVPPPEPVSPTAHLEAKKKVIYESLRDLQFEYRMDKLSDQDYQDTKLELQKQLASVLAEIEKLQAAPAPHRDAAAPHRDAPASHRDAPTPSRDAPAPHLDTPAPHRDAPAPHHDAPAPHRGALWAHQGADAPAPAQQPRWVCPKCATEFSQPMKFCGECGQPLAVST